MKRFLFILLLLISTQVNAKMKIVATYPPIQSLVLQITQGVYPVGIIHKKGAKHHHVELKPSQMKSLQKADIVFFAGKELESYIPQAVQTVCPNALVVPLIENHHLKTKNHPLHLTQTDMHFWLDIDNAIASLDKIEAVMSQKDPKNKEKFLSNKQKAIEYLKSLKEKASVIPQDKKFVALHEGFDYFFDYFNINGTTLAIEPEEISTPAKIKNFREQIKQINPDCIIIEPSLSNADKSKLGLDDYNLQRMDAFGWNINNGAPQLYRMFMWDIEQLKKCSQK